MDVFSHGDHVVLEGEPNELLKLANSMEEEDTDELMNEAIGRIRRGVDKGATSIAVPRKQAINIKTELTGSDSLIVNQWIELIEGEVKTD